jgi:hypothetical protein
MTILSMPHARFSVNARGKGVIVVMVHPQYVVSLAGALTASILLVASPAQATPPAGGTCQAPWLENTTLVNPQDPGFFAKIDKNGDGVICIKDWTGPDPDPDIGFLAIDNVVRHRA